MIRLEYNDGWLAPMDKRIPSQHYSSREGQTVDLIVVHNTGGSHNVARRTAEWFRNPDSKVSSHFVIGGDGDIIQCVVTTLAAWHAGAKRSRYLGQDGANQRSIGIELANNGRDPFPPLQIRALEMLLAKLWEYLGPLSIVGHREICVPPTLKPVCPHDGFPLDLFRPADPEWGDKREVNMVAADGGFMDEIVPVGHFGPASEGSMVSTDERIELDRIFTFHPVKGDQGKRYGEIRDAARTLATLITTNSGPSFERATALNKIREAVMWANAGIACNE